MIRKTLILARRWPRTALAVVLALTFPAVKVLWERLEEKKIQQVIALQKSMGYPTEAAGAGKISPDFLKPMKAALELSDKGREFISFIPKASMDLALSRFEEFAADEFAEVEKFRRDPEVGQFRFSDAADPDYQNYLRLLDDYLRSAGYCQLTGDTGKSMQRLETAMWLCEYFRKETVVEKFGVFYTAFAAMSFQQKSGREALCGALNELSLKWNQMRQGDREKTLGLIRSLLDMRPMAREFQNQMAGYIKRAFIYPISLKGLTIALVDQEKMENKFGILRPAIRHDFRVRREYIFNIQRQFGEPENTNKIEFSTNSHTKYMLNSLFYDELFIRIWEDFRDMVITSRMTAMHLACELYRVDHGKLPARLADLVPQYLDEIPKAPNGWVWDYTPGENPELGLIRNTPPHNMFKYETLPLRVTKEETFWMDYFNENYKR